MIGELCLNSAAAVFWSSWTVVAEEITRWIRSLVHFLGDWDVQIAIDWSISQLASMLLAHVVHVTAHAYHLGAWNKTGHLLSMRVQAETNKTVMVHFYWVAQPRWIRLSV